MKKILLFAYLCLSLVVVSNDGLHVGSLAFFAPLPARCTQKDALKTIAVRQVMIHLYCGVSESDQVRIVEFVGHALDAMPAGALPGAQVFAFTDLDHGVAAEHAFLEGEGYNVSAGQLRLAWMERGYLGQTFKSAVFLYVGSSSWQRDSRLASLTVLHEMHHLLQYQLVDSNQHIPLWLLEGGADEFALLEMAHLHLPLPIRSSPSYGCDYDLAALESERADVPLACAYVEGAQAVQILLGERREQAYYQLLRNIGAGASFDAAFSRAYGSRLPDFYRAFSAGQESGFTMPPRFAVPLASP